MITLLRPITESIIQTRIKNGRGVAEGKEYKPWLTIHDVKSSLGKLRLLGNKTDRKHDIFGRHEADYFRILDLSSSVYDIRERYPLGREETQKIADALGLRHPFDPITECIEVITTDFLIAVFDGTQTLQIARAFVPSSELTYDAMLIKLEIQRQYWQLRDIDWGIVTERDIPKALAKNAELLHRHGSLIGAKLVQDKISAIDSVLRPQVLSQLGSLSDLAIQCDEQLGFNLGTSLDAVKQLIASHKWHIDWNQELDPTVPLILQNH